MLRFNQDYFNQCSHLSETLRFTQMVWTMKKHRKFLKRWWFEKKVINPIVGCVEKNKNKSNIHVYINKTHMNHHGLISLYVNCVFLIVVPPGYIAPLQRDFCFKHRFGRSSETVEAFILLVWGIVRCDFCWAKTTYVWTNHLIYLVLSKHIFGRLLVAVATEIPKL